VHRELGKLDDAVASYNKAIALKPDYAEAYSNLGLVHKELGEPDHAVTNFHKAIAIKPDYADAYSNLGNAFQDLGKFDEAVDSYNKAIDIKPDFVEAYSNLGNALKELGQLDEAVESFHKAIAIKSDYAEAHYNMGTALKGLGQLDKAVASYNNAIDIKPDYVEAYSNLGITFQVLGKLDEAVASFGRALEIMPENAKTSVALSHSLYTISIKDLGRAQELALSFMEAFPKDDILRRGVSGITKIANYSTKAERLYTTSIFDNFAKTFENTLGKLSYDIPEKLARVVYAVDRRTDLDILDAGCGTGLCGSHFRARARYLVGVDLSANMLAEAGGKLLYDDLVEADLVSFMENKPASFDLVVSADVLVYIGDIAPLAQAAYLTLRPGGICIVSVESLDDDVGSPFILKPSGRYQHTSQYVYEAFTTAGFTVDPLQKTTVRLEVGIPVPAWIVLARK
jgi:predicted TPR repeat methyltransferase